MGTLILMFYKKGAETFACKSEADAISDARAWIRRRRERSGDEVEAGYYSECQIDTAAILAEIEMEEARCEREQREAEERALYERLRAKYEKPTTNDKEG